MRRIAIALAGMSLIVAGAPARAADSVMVQCGREYQAARSAGTLNGADWNRYRVDCAARLKATSAAAATTPAPAVAPPAAAAAPGATPQPAPAMAPASTAAAAPGATPQPAPAMAPASTAAAAPSGGMAAMHARQKRCGAEWTAQKATLVAQTPGLTWPRYWSLCNTRLKASGG